MVKHIKGFLLSLLLLFSFSGCMIRLIQLLKFTDIDTGLITGAHSLSYIVYALAGLAMICGVIYSFLNKDGKIPELSNSKRHSMLFLILSISFFWDFLHQCLNTVRYLDSTLIVEYNYTFAVIALGICALICSVYFYMISLTAKGTYYDYRKFNLLHFCVILWGFMKLLILMLNISDIVYGSEYFCEFIFCIMVIISSFCYISILDKKQDNPSKLLTFSALGAISMSIIIALPRLLAHVANKQSLIHKSDFSVLTYLMLAITMLILVIDTAKKQKEV